MICLRRSISLNRFGTNETFCIFFFSTEIVESNNNKNNEKSKQEAEEGERRERKKRHHNHETPAISVFNSFQSKGEMKTINSLTRRIDSLPVQMRN